MANDENSETNKEIREANATEKTFNFFKVLGFRIPLFIPLLLAILYFGYIGYKKITVDPPVNLRPAIQDARGVNITIFTCNENIDSDGYNIRDEERRLVKKFQSVEKVRAASVTINRDSKDCPTINK
ncbi:MAG: hypothetical protein U0R17_03350 [Acidimicrobiia bacterium]